MEQHALPWVWEQLYYLTKLHMYSTASWGRIAEIMHESYGMDLTKFEAEAMFREVCDISPDLAAAVDALGDDHIEITSMLERWSLTGIELKGLRDVRKNW
ncbi:MAG: hypothetical protein M1838_000247 [Thelocarpon superellum]|nr:MAG: hypothetical protein M1838_000247 [Thelocarpon superellum]